MEIVEIISVILLAFFLMGPIIALHEANLATGGIGGKALPAPQAGLMAQLAKGIVGGQMAWGLLGIGAAFGIALLLCGARSPMLIAVGMYLPFSTTSAIFIGGLIKWILNRISERRSAEQKLLIEERGTLLASGLIAGRKAIVGILLAVVFLTGNPFPQFSFYPAWGGWLSLIGFASIAYAKSAFRQRRSNSSISNGVWCTHTQSPLMSRARVSKRFWSLAPSGVRVCKVLL